MHVTTGQKAILASKGAVEFLERQALAARNTAGESSILRMVVIEGLLQTARDELQDAKLREMFNVS
jgi:hypothetical protein